MKLHGNITIKYHLTAKMTGITTLQEHETRNSKLTAFLENLLKYTCRINLCNKSFYNLKIPEKRLRATTAVPFTCSHS